MDSGGTLPFPGGESREAFQERCRAEFTRVLRTLGRQAGSNAVFVVHGGTIMSILSAYAAPEGKLPGQKLLGETLPGQTPSGQAPQGAADPFYRWQVKNGEGWRALWDETDKGGIWLYGISHIGPGSGASA